jgi:hypothetical protein
MHENRKNKPFKTGRGGDRVSMQNSFLYPTYVPIYYPKGCSNEIQIYKECVKKSGKSERCMDEKLNIMEVCPKWVLELLRERKRTLMRTTLIDNQTYRRAMEVSDYNKGRSIKDLKTQKTWEDGHPNKLRSDAYNTFLNIIL